MKYIIVLQRDGINYFLQMRKVLNWFFNNNHAKAFKSIKTAIKNADSLLARFGNNHRVYVFQIEDGEEYSASIVNRWIGTSKEVYTSSIVEHLTRHNRTHEERLYIYEHRNSLSGIVVDSYGNIVMSADFPDEDINRDVYRVKEYFGYNENNSY